MSERSKVVQEETRLPLNLHPPKRDLNQSLFHVTRTTVGSSLHPHGNSETTSAITMLPKNKFWRQLQAVRSAARVADGLGEHSQGIAEFICTRAGVLGWSAWSEKSFTSRVVSHLLGRIPDESYFEIPVQSHWENDDALFGPQGVLVSLEECDPEKGDRLILFDEINLTEPESAT